MTIQTSRGQTFDVRWCWAPVSDGTMMLCLQDERRLPEIAADFDGLEQIDRISAIEGDMTYEGYSEMTGISRDAASGDVVVTLAHPRDTGKA